MSQGLPEDVNQWPEDPWDLLGVSHEADRREVRRAYARLIRTYKPEHAPVQFRRIRDAYEFLDGYLQFQEATGSAGPGAESADASPSASDDGAATAGPPADEAVDGSPAATPVPASSDRGASAPRIPEIEAIWEQALAGDLPGAYAALRRLHDTRRGDEELCARLYWLLTLWPRLDPQEDPRRWLVEGLLKSGLSGRLLELYRRELAREPDEAYSERFGQLLESPATPLRLAELLAMRWQAAAALMRIERIKNELDWARQRIAAQDPAAWGRLLVAAIEYLAWEDGLDVSARVDACRRELDAASLDHQALAHELDRCDFLFQLVAHWRQLSCNVLLPREIVRPLCKLTRDSWLLPFSEVRAGLMSLLAELLGNPLQSLLELDRIRNVAPAVVYHFHSLVDALYRERTDPEGGPNPDEVAESVKGFLGGKLAPYDTMRPYLATFCIGERLTVERVSTAAEKVLAPAALQNSGLLEVLARDVALQLLAKASLALWP